MQAKVASSPVYYYYFSYPGDNNEAKSHGADGKYFFGNFFVPGPLTPNETKMKDIMVDMLISFAKTSIPVIEGVKWETTAYDKLTYLNIRSFRPEEIELLTVDELTPREFWHSLKFAENENLFSDERPVVTTSLGKIRGYIKTSHDGRKFSAFEGLPFAKPPIGSRRFEVDEPEPAEPWSGVWDANNPTACAQTGLMEINVTQVAKLGDEDCLHINVFVPRENPNSQDKLDVIVHIHGGAYMYGSGLMFTPPEILMDRDVVFVTFNYRLGILGFLSTEDDVVPGNNGLKDQVMALRWIQNHIANFGAFTSITSPRCPKACSIADSPKVV
ncbi:hypothetical protein GEV33_001021 [Tenebrio molitor]|uniref:Carboxylesterase type B domain-containing protein n=1 Tax=Tenebrio molitor TaxID=7067 RepID=A0A8J6HN36_TENMO|nr:hypothetical protein GEV33_001021 [Tenebrio molitor]